jgi:DNA-binding response OmpR family regulator
MAKLLIIDDEADVCDFTKGFFEKRGFHVDCARDAQEGLSLLKELKPDIVLLDVKMPGMNGIEALKQIKLIAPSTIVIMVTAVDDIHKVNEAKSLGARDYLTKPLILEELESKVVSVASELNNKE